MSAWGLVWGLLSDAAAALTLPCRAAETAGSSARCPGTATTLRPRHPRSPRRRAPHLRPHPAAAPPPGYPLPPLVLNGSALLDGRSRKPVTLRGVSWFGFNNAGGMVDGLWVGGNRSDTDLHALTYQIKLLGFNAVRLPFTFDDLAQRGRSQVMECKADNYTAWAARAADPEAPPPPAGAAPEPPVYIKLDEWEQPLCNTYIPGNGSVLSGERLLWAVEYFVASGFYIVVSGGGWLDLILTLTLLCMHW